MWSNQLPSHQWPNTLSRAYWNRPTHPHSERSEGWTAGVHHRLIRGTTDFIIGTRNTVVRGHLVNRNLAAKFALNFLFLNLLQFCTTIWVWPTRKVHLTKLKLYIVLIIYHLFNDFWTHQCDSSLILAIYLYSTVLGSIVKGTPGYKNRIILIDCQWLVTHGANYILIAELGNQVTAGHFTFNSPKELNVY